MTNNKFSLGSDPEVFLKKVIDGIEVYFPAVEVITGDKNAPTKIDNEGRAILVDNVMLEFNTKPTYDMDNFVKEHLTFIEYLTNEMNKKECKLSKKAYVEFNPKYLQSDSAKLFGCDPDFNAYTMERNIPPEASVNFRSAAGHIHIGYDGHCVDTTRELIKLLDFTLGLQSVIDDDDRGRRLMYGQAGAFRFKNFGLEYRVLSNYWIFTPEKLRKVYNGVIKAFELHEMGFSLDKKLEKDTIEAINTYNVDTAKRIINEQLNNIK